MPYVSQSYPFFYIAVIFNHLLEKSKETTNTTSSKFELVLTTLIVIVHGTLKLMVTGLISMQEIIQLLSALLDMPFQVIWNCSPCSNFQRTSYNALDGNGIRWRT